jgi:FKBP-type peptidyl-prolyl cis-trans isomerase SlpA
MDNLKSDILEVNNVRVSNVEKENVKQTVTHNTKITLHFSLQLANGQLIDSTREKSPATFVYGDGNLLPNFEKLLLGLKVGDKRSFILPANKAFGEYNHENSQAIPRTQFSKNLELKPGLLIAFADASGEELPGLVKSINERFVLIDFNHPLAGKEIIFEAEILDLEKLTAEFLIYWIEKFEKQTENSVL